jgi:hypothetical protein
VQRHEFRNGNFGLQDERTEAIHLCAGGHW